MKFWFYIYTCHPIYLFREFYKDAGRKIVDFLSPHLRYALDFIDDVAIECGTRNVEFFPMSVRCLDFYYDDVEFIFKTSVFGMVKGYEYRFYLNGERITEYEYIGARKGRKKEIRKTLVFKKRILSEKAFNEAVKEVRQVSSLDWNRLEEAQK